MKTEAAPATAKKLHYKGQTVKLLREVKYGDPEHTPGSDHVVICGDDNVEHLVPRTEVS